MQGPTHLWPFSSCFLYKKIIVFMAMFVIDLGSMRVMLT